MFSEALDSVLTVKPGVFQYDELAPEQLQQLQVAAEKSGELSCSFDPSCRRTAYIIDESCTSSG